MDAVPPRPLAAGLATGLTVGLAWGLVDGVAAWEHSSLLLGPGAGLQLVACGMGAGALLGLLAALPGAAWPRLRAPLPSGSLALALLTAVTALARLVREPVLGREVQPLPGGVPTAVAASLLLGAVPLVAVLASRAARPRIALTVWKLWAVAVVAALWLLPRVERVGSPPPPAPHAPPVVLVTLDTFRADHVGALGAEGDPTPHLDALAAEGALFTRAFAQIPVTGPSHASILSGVDPWTHETLANGVAMPPDVAVLPQRLHAVGYRTAGFVSAFVLDGAFGFDRGFQVFDDEFVRPRGISALSPLRVVEQVRVRVSSVSDVERRGGETVDAALAWADTVEAGEPYFLWVHLFDPHGPYAPPPPYDTRYYEGDPRDPVHDSMEQVGEIAPYLRPSLEGVTDVRWPLAQYRGEIAYTDAELGRLLDGLRQRGLLEGAVIVVVADHGESLTEHDYWFNHGAQLYAPSLHVPLVLVAPEVPAGTRVEAVVENVDIAPTVLALAGLEVPGELSGESLLPAVDGAVEEGRVARSICFDRESNRATGAFMRYRKIGLRSAAFSFIYREEGPEELYNLGVDPLERDDLAARAEQGFLVQGLTERAEELLARVGLGAVDRAAGELGPGIEDRLRALGYVEEQDPR